MVFGGKTEGVVNGKGILCDGRGGDGAGDGTKGGVVVMRCDAIALFKVHKLRHILIAVTGVEEFTVAASDGEKRARGHGFGWVPNEEIYLRVVILHNQL